MECREGDGWRGRGAWTLSSHRGPGQLRGPRRGFLPSFIQDWVLAPRALSGTDPAPRSHSRFTLQRQPNPTDLELSTVTPGRHIQPAEERRQPQGRALGTGPASACRTTLTHSPASANVAAEMGRSQATGQGHRKSLGRQREHLGAGRAVSSGQPREIVHQRPVELGREQPH